MWKTSLLFLFAVNINGLSCRSTGDTEVVPIPTKEVLKVVELESSAPEPTTTGQRIIGGTYTTIEKYPYVVQVLRSNQLTCGGSLLTTKIVLSAAHCFVDENGLLLSYRLFSIRAGSSILNSGGQTRAVTKIINHEMYNSPVRDNDISILVLASRVTLSNSVAVASIPAQALFEVPDNAAVVHVGWGSTNIHIPVLSTQLQEVSVYAINRNTCAYNYAYLATLYQQPFPVTNNMICAGVLGIGGRDACQGDSGGPLIYNGVVVGVTSWGYSCAEPYYPGVSARVASYTQWINRTVESNSGNASKISGVFVLVSLISALQLR